MLRGVVSTTRSVLFEGARSVFDAGALFRGRVSPISSRVKICHFDIRNLYQRSALLCVCFPSFSNRRSCSEFGLTIACPAVVSGNSNGIPPCSFFFFPNLSTPDDSPRSVCSFDGSEITYGKRFTIVPVIDKIMKSTFCSFYYRIALRTLADRVDVRGLR